MAIVELQAVSKDYPLGNTIVHALKNVDFSIEKGELICLVGPSGSGKTTLLNLIGCIDTPTRGTVKIDEVEINNLSDNSLTDLRLYKIGFIFQTFNLIPVLNVLENVEFPLLLMKKLSRAEIRDRAMQVIEQVRIVDQIHHKPAELSGGQRQRVAIARALVTNPEIVLADEPTANLDSETGHAILHLMQELNETRSTTFVFSTHDPDVLKFAKRIVKIRDGQIVS